MFCSIRLKACTGDGVDGLRGNASYDHASILVSSSCTCASQERMASIVIWNSRSSSQPRRSAPIRITSREQPAANFLSLNFFWRLDTSKSATLFEGRILTAAPMSRLARPLQKALFPSHARAPHRTPDHSHGCTRRE